MSGVVIEEFKPIARERSALRGVARVRMPSGMIIDGIMVFSQDGKNWVMPPTKPSIKSDGTVYKKDGKPVYTPVISFADKETRQKFSDAVCRAVEAARPGAFA
jgi:hypothetical protein